MLGFNNTGGNTSSCGGKLPQFELARDCLMVDGKMSAMRLFAISDGRIEDIDLPVSRDILERG